MKKQHITPRQIKPILRVILVGLALIILSQGLDLPSRHVLDFLTAVVQHTVVLLPSLALTAWQGFDPTVSSQPHFSVCAVEMLVFWPLLGTAAKMA